MNTPRGVSTLYAVSCASASLCVAGGNDGNMLASTDPTGGAGAWTIASVDGVNPLSGVSCPSVSLCVAVDQAGNVVTSTSPTGGAGAWKTAKIDSPVCPQLGRCAGLSGVSCASVSLCVAVGTAGNVASSTDPTGGPSAWHIAHVAAGGCVFGGNCYGLSAVSCPTVSLCVAVDADGSVVTSTKPTGGRGAWHAFAVDKRAVCTPDSGCVGPSGVSCPSASLCVAVDQVGDVVTSTSPIGAASAWKTTRVNGIGSCCLSAGVSCPLLSLCVVVDGAGTAASAANVVTSTNPTGGARSWIVANVDANQGLAGVSCAKATSLCVVGDSAGNVVSSINPIGGAGAWTATQVEAGAVSTTPLTPPGVSSVSCPSASLCVAVDGLGNLVIGQGPASPPPTNTSAPKIHGTALQGHRLAALRGLWMNSPAVFSYQWEDCTAPGERARRSLVRPAKRSWRGLWMSDTRSGAGVRHQRRRHRTAGDLHGDRVGEAQRRASQDAAAQGPQAARARGKDRRCAQARWVRLVVPGPERRQSSGRVVLPTPERAPDKSNPQAGARRCSQEDVQERGDRRASDQTNRNRQTTAPTRQPHQTHSESRVRPDRPARDYRHKCLYAFPLAGATTDLGTQYDARGVTHTSPRWVESVVRRPASMRPAASIPRHWRARASAGSGGRRRARERGPSWT